MLFGKPAIKNQDAAPLLAALVLAALVPAVGVLWFMTVAMRNERLAVQERLAAVYLNHLEALRPRVAAWVQERQGALTARANGPPAGIFATLVGAGLADGVVVGGATGRVLYPSEAEAGRTANADDERARTLQAQAAALLKAGQKEQALAQLVELTGNASLRNAVGTSGALIVPNAQLLMLKLQGSEGGTARRAVAAQENGRPGEASPPREMAPPTLSDLVARLNDYGGAAMPSSQRRFLMREMVALAPGAANFPTLGAEDLAAEYLEREPARPEATTGTGGASSPREEAVTMDGAVLSRREAAPTTDRIEAGSDPAGLAAPKLRRTALGKVWSLPSADRSVLALLREDRLKADLHAWLAPFALSEVRVAVLPPGESFQADKRVPPLDAGESLPGWRLALRFNGIDPLSSASDRQSRYYLGIGFAVVVIIALVAWLVARYVAAQMRLARLKNELVSTVSHELKTPLASMRALVDTLLARRYRDDAQLQEYLELVAKENLRLSHLMENFLAFSRMERGQRQFRFAELPPQQVVRMALDALGEKLAAPGCQLTTRVAADLPLIHGDADALTSVLVNLLDNACKYTNGEKRLAVSVYAEPGRVAPSERQTSEEWPPEAHKAPEQDRSVLSFTSLWWPSAASTTGGSSVVFEISDSGIGIPREEQRRIFDRFYQVDQSLTRQRGGCGLGLSIVKFIVDAHRGAIEVRSAPGEGSTFRVRIPVANSASGRKPVD